MNEKKFCIIMCVNDDIYEDECLKFISAIEVPEGYELEQLSVRDASSMCGGYNEAMVSSDAKYKIYIHQDVFITNRKILYDLLDLFADKSVGMIGLVGCEKMPDSLIMWEGNRIGRAGICSIRMTGDCMFEANPILGRVRDVQAIDGLFMATQVDISWREDIFSGWDFYDVSQSYEFTRKGYRVVVPDMPTNWVIHDDGVLNMASYYKYRDVFSKEYICKDVKDEGILDYDKDIKKVKNSLIEIDDLLASNSHEKYKVIATYFTPEFCNEYVAKSAELLSIFNIFILFSSSNFENIEPYFRDCVTTKELIDRWNRLKFMLWEMEYNLTIDAEKDFGQFIVENRISRELIDHLVNTSAIHK